MIKFLIALILAAVPLYSFAQIDATVTVTPQYPNPHEQAVLTLSSYYFDVNVSNITWKSGNKTLLSGLGAKTLTVTVGDVGQSLPVSYRATNADGSFVEGSITITPQSVDLAYEAVESYVPLFYEGKALPGEGSVVRVIALPTLYDGTTKIPASNLSYNWYVNGEYLDRASGVGRQAATIGMEYLTHSTDIRVLVRSQSGQVAEKTYSIYPKEVLPLVYPYDEILGVDLTRPFFRRMELSGDITLSLEPFYFSTKAGLEQSSSYAWYIDGLPVTPQEKTLLALRPKEDSVGTRTLSIVVEHGKRLLQSARADIEILFDTRN